jgi:hypothetical protein
VFGANGVLQVTDGNAGRVERPVIIVSTNPRAGTLGAGIAGQTLTHAITLVDRVGQRLSQEVVHQAFLGTRALLYLDGQADAGLSQAITMTAIGLAIGLLLGGIVTLIYDRRGYHRIPPSSSALRLVAAKSQRPNVIGLRLNRHATVTQVSCDTPVLNVVLFLPIFAPKGQPCRLSPPASGASQPAASG